MRTYENLDKLIKDNDSESIISYLCRDFDILDDISPRIIKVFNVFTQQYSLYSSWMLKIFLVQTILDKRYFYSNYTGLVINFMDFERTRQIYLKLKLNTFDQAYPFMLSCFDKRNRFKASYEKYSSYLASLLHDDNIN